MITLSGIQCIFEMKWLPVGSKSHFKTGLLQKTRVKSADDDDGTRIPLKSPADNCQRRAKPQEANPMNKT